MQTKAAAREFDLQTFYTTNRRVPIQDPPPTSLPPKASIAPTPKASASMHKAPTKAPTPPKKSYSAVSSSSYYYAVARGCNPGIYGTWSECKEQVENYRGAVFRKFESKSEAEEYLQRF